ncbi:GNAT family N-acetyltransferase [Larkinella rosea]|uniref:N-acetyltransferase n=1 Tax=Larkinella rosea TaxID=2025312 RepID=A0A3P1BDQ3_9BACT|nr:GNAT family protein [Larkinella rosea]RRA98633.1 N-acetyltransferase [Larkinella rosea]
MLLPKIQTERLILNKYTEADLDNIKLLLSEPLVWEFSSEQFSSGIYPERIYLQKMLQRYSDGKCSMFALKLNDSRTYIGEAGLLLFDEKINKVEIGFNILPKYWYNGYATEIIKAIIDFLFLSIQIERIEAITVVGNVRSEKALLKAGLKKEKTIENYNKIDGNSIDVFLYSILNQTIYKITTS